MPRTDRAKVGAIVERRACEKFGLRGEGEHTSYCDAVDSSGRPVETKSAVKLRAPKRETGKRYPGYFQLRVSGHERLGEFDQASYVFAVFDQDAGKIVRMWRVPYNVVDRIVERVGSGGSGLINIRWDVCLEATERFA